MNLRAYLVSAYGSGLGLATVIAQTPEEALEAWAQFAAGRIGSAQPRYDYIIEASPAPGPLVLSQAAIEAVGEGDPEPEPSTAERARGALAAAWRKVRRR